MQQYDYLFCDLLTNAVLAELPLGRVRFTCARNGAGTFSASLAIGDTRVARQGPISATIPGRTAMYVLRDGEPLYGGIVWTRRYKASEGHIEIGGAEWWSYFHRRFITTTAEFSQVDQLEIARSLVSTAQAEPDGDIGVFLDAGHTSGRLRDRTYVGTELKPVGEAVEQLSAVLDGFDFRSAVELDANGDLRKRLAMGYPALGRDVEDTGLVFEMPGPVVDYEWPEDGSSMANTVHAVGADHLRSTASVANRAGWPLLEAAASYTDVSRQNTLDDHASADLDALDEPVTLPGFTVRGDIEPVLGSYTVGDEARLRVTDSRFPDGAEFTSRITSYTVTPPQGDMAESVQITLEEAAS